MNKIKLVWVVVVCGSMIGCAAAKRTQKFEESHFAFFAAGGNNIFNGNVKTSYMGINGVVEAGNLAYLTPATPYTQEWFEKAVVGGKRLEPPDPRLERYQRSAKIDR